MYCFLNDFINMIPAIVYVRVPDLYGSISIYDRAESLRHKRREIILFLLAVYDISYEIVI